MKNILLIDDSALMRRVLSDIICSDDRLHVIGEAVNGFEALQMISDQPKLYDCILLDIIMPRMSGIQLLEELNKRKLSQKIIIVSTIANEGAKETIQCLELGAFDFVKKPTDLRDAKNGAFREQILYSVAIATGLIKADKNRYHDRHTMTDDKRITVHTSEVSDLRRLPMGKVVRNTHRAVTENAKKLVAIACSTGGPKALQRVIPQIPAEINAPIIIVQHMPSGFTNSLAIRLNEMSKIKVKEAQDGDILEKGVAYIAMGGMQLRIVKCGTGYSICLSDEPARNGLKPCADIMFESLLNTEYDDIICTVMTGMGSDGTLGINQLNDKKNIYVISQDEASCTVYGMPKVLVDAGLADEVVTLEKIAEQITKNVGCH